MAGLTTDDALGFISSGADLGLNFASNSLPQFFNYAGVDAFPTSGAYTGSIAELMADGLGGVNMGQYDQLANAGSGIGAYLDTANTWLKDHNDLLKWGGAGLGGLASYLSAQKYNKLAAEARKRQEALLAAKQAEAMKYNDPVKYQLALQQISAPTESGGMAQFFANNGLGRNTVMARGGYVGGSTPGQADKVPALLSDGEYVMDAETVSALGDGNNAAGASALDQMRQNIRKHKRSAPANKIPPKAKTPEAYLKSKKFDEGGYVEDDYDAPVSGPDWSQGEQVAGLGSALAEAALLRRLMNLNVKAAERRGGFVPSKDLTDPSQKPLDEALRRRILQERVAKEKNHG